MTNHDVDAWYCFMIIGRRPDDDGGDEDAGDDYENKKQQKLFSLSHYAQQQQQQQNKRQKSLVSTSAERATGTEQKQPRTYIYLARNPQQIVDNLNNGESIREEDGVELTVELANVLNEKRKLNGISSPSGSSTCVAIATSSSFASVYSLAARGTASNTADAAAAQSLDYVGRSVPFVLPAPESIVLPPLCISRLSHPTLAVDQLETIHIARELEYANASVEEIRQRLFASDQYLQQQYYQQQQRKRYQSFDAPTTTTTAIAGTAVSVSEDITAATVTVVTKTKKETQRKSNDASKPQQHHHHHHGNLSYKLGMVVGPLLLRKSARLFATLWGIKSRGQVSRASLGEDLAGWMALDMFADLTLILSGDRPLQYHALLQSVHGDVWLVELSKKEQLQQRLAVL